VPKVTEAELARHCEEEQLRLQREVEAAKKRQARTAEIRLLLLKSILLLPSVEFRIG
jgi:hypothetical protein